MSLSPQLFQRSFICCLLRSLSQGVTGIIFVIYGSIEVNDNEVKVTIISKVANTIPLNTIQSQLDIQFPLCKLLYLFLRDFLITIQPRNWGDNESKLLCLLCPFQIDLIALFIMKKIVRCRNHQSGVSFCIACLQSQKVLCQ